MPGGAFAPPGTQAQGENYALILISTPAGRVRVFNASIVLPVGFKISMRRLCVRISNCSRDLRSMFGERKTVNFSQLVGRGIGPAMQRRYALLFQQCQLWNDRADADRSL